MLGEAGELRRERMRGADRPLRGAHKLSSTDFSRLVREHRRWMLAVAQRHVGDRALAEDCVQDALLNAFRNIDRFEGRSSLKCWLHSIVVNAALSALRARRRLGALSGGGLPADMGEDDGRLDAIWTRSPTVEETLQSKDDRAFVRAKLALLPEPHRQVLQLRDIEEKSTAEAARALGVSEGTTKVRLHRARLALKSLIERDFADI